MQKNANNMSEKKIWEEDVKAMTYDDLMAAIRFLDQEREMLAKSVHERAAVQTPYIKIRRKAA